MDGHLRDLYEGIKDEVVWVQPYWKEISDSLADELDPDNFLNQRQVLDTMNPLAASEIEYYGGIDWLPFNLKEPMIGGQTIWRDGRSANFYRQLHHIVAYESEMNKQLSFGDVWVEWGGGYGLMAYIVRELFVPRQHVIIDLPIFTVLQYHFLSEVYGEDKVSIGGHTPICLIPQSRANDIGECDVFLSTWALSESPQEAIDYVEGRDFFEAQDNVLLAFQTADDKFPFAQTVAEELTTFEIEHIPGNFYGFR